MGAKMYMIGDVMEEVKSPKIAIFGVGTAGCNALDVLAESDIADKVKLVAVDTEADGVRSHNADVKIAMYKGHPASLHQPWTVQRGRRGALEVYEEIKKALIQ